MSLAIPVITDWLSPSWVLLQALQALQEEERIQGGLCYGFVVFAKMKRL